MFKLFSLFSNKTTNCSVFFNSLCTFLSTVNCPEMELATIKFRRD